MSIFQRNPLIEICIEMYLWDVFTFWCPPAVRLGLSARPAVQICDGYVSLCVCESVPICDNLRDGTVEPPAGLLRQSRAETNRRARRRYLRYASMPPEIQAYYYPSCKPGVANPPADGDVWEIMQARPAGGEAVPKTVSHATTRALSGGSRSTNEMKCTAWERPHRARPGQGLAPPSPPEGTVAKRAMEHWQGGGPPAGPPRL